MSIDQFAQWIACLRIGKPGFKPVQRVCRDHGNPCCLIPFIAIQTFLRSIQPELRIGTHLLLQGGDGRRHIFAACRKRRSAQNGALQRASPLTYFGAWQAEAAEGMFQHGKDRNRCAARCRLNHQPCQCSGRSRKQRLAGGVVRADAKTLQFHRNAACQRAVGRDQSRRFGIVFKRFAD